MAMIVSLEYVWCPNLKEFICNALNGIGKRQIGQLLRPSRARVHWSERVEEKMISDADEWYGGDQVMFRMKKSMGTLTSCSCSNLGAC